MKMKEMYNPAQGIRPEDLFTQKPKARMQSAPQKKAINPNTHEAWSIPLS